MIQQLRNLQAAFVSFTRLPLASEKLEASNFSIAHYYLPLVGLIIGLICATIFQISSVYLSPETSALITIFSGILFTGALHEDGFADCCDGFGAGGDAATIQQIMKDSRLGTYGILGLVGLISLKISLLNDIIIERQLLALVLMHCLARICPLLIMATLQPITAKNTKMSANLQQNSEFLAITLTLTGICLFLATPTLLAAWLVLAILLTAIACKNFFFKKLNGYNGDCLGAAEQIGECCILLVFAIYY